MYFLGERIVDGHCTRPRFKTDYYWVVTLGTFHSHSRHIKLSITNRMLIMGSESLRPLTGYVFSVSLVGIEMCAGANNAKDSKTQDECGGLVRAGRHSFSESRTCVLECSIGAPRKPHTEQFLASVISAFIAFLVTLNVEYC